jgi:hypothetical protein
MKAPTSRPVDRFEDVYVVVDRVCTMSRRRHSDGSSLSERSAAGAATAMLLARAGLTVTLVDRSAYGTDSTVSTTA